MATGSDTEWFFPRPGPWAGALLLLAAWTSPGHAAELQADTTYAGGTRVEASSLGLSFVIPPDWIGRFGQTAQHQVLVLTSTAMEGLGLAVLQSPATPRDLAAGLNTPQALGSGVVLQPTGPPVTQGSRVLVRYENELYVGRALALVGPARHGVVFFFAGPREHEPAYAALLQELEASTRFQAPGTPPAQAAAVPPGGLGQAWRDLLAGQALHYFSSYNSGGGGGGMAAHRILHLCADGRFAYGDDSLVTMTVPGASGFSGSRDGFQGRWSLEAPTETTVALVLAVEGGQPLRWQVRYDGRRTFVNGARWLREPSKVCR
jgi:hypothetical protein